jgi:hypothetical protein
MWYPLFIVGGAWFYSLIIIESLFLLWCLEDFKPGFAVFTTILTLALLAFFGDFNLLTWIIQNPKMLILYALGYILLGLVWGIAKYWMFLTDMRRKFDRIVESFLEDEQVKVTRLGSGEIKVPEDCQRKCRERVFAEMGYEPIPTFTGSSKYIIFWMSFWVWSMTWTVLNNPIKWAFEELYHQMSGLFKRMHKKIIGNRGQNFDGWGKL